MYAAKILADSIAQDVRLVTIEATFPRFILAEVNTHRNLSRNSASSRAIPVERRIEQVMRSPFVPEAFGQNKSGMQADSSLASREQDLARAAWLAAANYACDQARQMASLGVHKQHANRLLEPFVWHTAVMSATEWENFFALRTHKDAQPEMQIIAKLMRKAYDESTPRELRMGDWHLPYVTPEEHDVLESFRPPAGEQQDAWQELQLGMVKKSVVCCAAVSYERHLTERTLEQCIARHDAMTKSAHWSPFEHQAKVTDRSRGEVARPGNFRAPWTQYRKMFKGEAVWTGGGEP